MKNFKEENEKILNEVKVLLDQNIEKIRESDAMERQKVDEYLSNSKEYEEFKKEEEFERKMKLKKN